MAMKKFKPGDIFNVSLLIVGIIGILLLLFVTSIVYAQQDYPRDLELSWTQPTQYTDGTPIGTGELRGVLITCWRSNDPNTLVIEQERTAPTPGGQYSYNFVGVIPQPGTYNCVAYAVTLDDIYSDMSNTIDRKYTGKPNPQTLTIVVN